MKIRKLTSATEKKIFAARAARDVEAERVAAEIVADVRNRGDKALFEWTKKLDGIDLAAEGVWIGEMEIRSARRAADKELVRAIETRHGMFGEWHSSSCRRRGALRRIAA